MSYTLEFILKGLPKTPNGGHGHWRAKAAQAREWKSRALMAIDGETPLKPLTKAVAHFKRHSSAEPDGDNLVISFKAVRDALKTAGVIVDDKPSCLTAHYGWEYSPPGKGFISVRVESV